MKNILITGANRGLGLEFVRQLSELDSYIFAACRLPEQADELQQLAVERKNIVVCQLDLAKDETILALAKKLSNQPLDWLINNAGISGAQGVTVGNIDRDNFLQVLAINCFGALKVADALLPQLGKGTEKLIINISSRMGSISDNQRGRSYAYRTSKAALNCAMRAFALDVANEGIHVMLLHPGWVKTRLGGPDAPIDAQTSVASMLKVIAKHKQHSHAEVLLSYDGSIIDW
ncbi:SDR family oxidoreductase [Legionella feeleii]|uniref:Oxidoreductase, short chain dehydrogenase/reductase n=1 Tax=Legionella feeleii TaxID=453 RepID=A0A378IR31_9GAMM|nr:SDR family oxidoreductase [Legionella feeleii]STX36951.1 oxidoreductase, short chain dehydrogenase/reductase [Legionella feeleii]